MTHKLYIDGIRGIAVLAVIFFHANYNTFQGGYLGVDIFFILSGYLIIASISNQNNFSFIQYYKRRFLRIVPAALMTLLMVLAFGLIVLFPEELIDLYKNIYYILTIKSNVLASEAIDYFGIGVEYKPLVHYWSLSIELQFYIFFPIMIFLFIKYRYEKILLLLLLTILVSSIIYATMNHNLSHNAKYFSTYMRLWEFALGASTFLIFKLYREYIEKQYTYMKLIPYLGLLMVGIPLIMFDNTFNVPGIYTLIPTLGVSLLLLFVTDKSHIGKLLSISLLRNIGIISYSLYLVHQPIFAFYRTIQDRDFDGIESIFLILFTFVLGYIFWRFIEKPFQNKQLKYVKFKIAFTLGIIISLIYFSKIEMHKKRSDYTESDAVKRYLLYRYDNNPRLKECRIDNKLIKPEKSCTYGSGTKAPSIVLWGDSHMDQIALPLSRELNRSGNNTIEFAIAGCPPIADIDIKNKDRKCYENAQIILAHILEHDEYKDIVLFGYWNYYFNTNNIDNTHDEIRVAINNTVKKLYEKGKRIHIIYPIPKMNVNPPLHKARLEKLFFENRSIIKLSQEEYIKQSQVSMNLLDSLPSKFKVNKIYISEFFKKDNNYIANDAHTVFYRDDNHLSTKGGGSKVSKGIAELINKPIKEYSKP